MERPGLLVEARHKDNPKLEAFRRNIHFPDLSFDLGLSAHKEERFLIKVEGQDQGIIYEPVIVNIKGCGFFFPCLSIYKHKDVKEWLDSKRKIQLHFMPTYSSWLNQVEIWSN